jgi:hypothetical protein
MLKEGFDMNFINIKISTFIQEKEFLVNIDNIRSLCVERISPSFEHLKKYGNEVYDIKGLPNPPSRIIMNSAQLSDLEKKLGVKIPIN